MRIALAATAQVLIFALVAATAAAQTVPTPPAISGVKPKRVATTPMRPALQTPTQTADAMAQAERAAIQSDLAFTGYYNGTITGEVGERMVAAIKAFQKDNRGKQTGVLNPQERGALGEAAKRRQGQVGWKIITDPGSGARLGIPGKLAPQQTSDANGTRWASSTGTIQIQLARRKEAAPTLAKLAERERKEPPGRRVEYSVVKPEFFVVSGMQGLKKFYVRGEVRDVESRTLTILYDQATEGTMDPVAVAMSSAFIPFPTAAQAGSSSRKPVEYGTGMIASADGAILTDRQATEGCLSIVVAGHGNADRIADDKERDLALLRVYGVRGLRPLGFGGGGAKAATDLTGIADPQGQGGGHAASVVKASTSGSSLSPAPPPGFSGAPARDTDGAFAGMALLRPVQVAGPAATSQATLVPADGVREFLRANNVAFSDAKAGDAAAAVVRVICVRK